jgi:hypothetical protein
MEQLTCRQTRRKQSECERLLLDFFFFFLKLIEGSLGGLPIRRTNSGKHRHWASILSEDMDAFFGSQNN